MDMLETDKHQEYFDQVIQYFGQVDVLVNNAGRSQRALWQDIDLKVDRELFDLDVFSVINLSRIYIRHVEKNSLEGHISVTSSSAGLLGVPNSCSYVGAKHALHGYFDSLKLEMPDFNITLFCPGPTTTSFLSTAFTNKSGENYGTINKLPRRPREKRKKLCWNLCENSPRLISADTLIMTGERISIPIVHGGYSERLSTGDDTPGQGPSWNIRFNLRCGETNYVAGVNITIADLPFIMGTVALKAMKKNLPKTSYAIKKQNKIIRV